MNSKGRHQFVVIVPHDVDKCVIREQTRDTGAVMRIVVKDIIGPKRLDRNDVGSVIFGM